VPNKESAKSSPNVILITHKEQWNVRVYSSSQNISNVNGAFVTKLNILTVPR
jgi:hypothetical protein